MELVILDRDGVINQDSTKYIRSPEEWVPIPKSLDAIARLNRAGFRVVIATNQAGIARRLFDIETLIRIHETMQHQLAEVGGHVDAIFICPCHPKDNCECRKPKPGMLLDISERHSGCARGRRAALSGKNGERKENPQEQARPK
jgi:D-glycero-D-manno-heptose 1,7-bisphosphate phosphatase